MLSMLVNFNSSLLLQSLRLGTTAEYYHHHADLCRRHYPFLARTVFDPVVAGIALKTASLALEHVQIKIPPSLASAYVIAPFVLASGICTSRHARSLLARPRVDRFMRPVISARRVSTFLERGEKIFSLVADRFSDFNWYLLLSISGIAIGCQRRFSLFTGLVAGVALHQAITKVTRYLKQFQWLQKHPRNIDLIVFSLADAGLTHRRDITPIDFVLHLISGLIMRKIYEFLSVPHSLVSSLVATHLHIARNEILGSPADTIDQIFHYSAIVYLGASRRIAIENRKAWSETISKKILIASSVFGSSWIIKLLPFNWSARDDQNQTMLHVVCSQKHSFDYMRRGMVRAIAPSMNAVDLNLADTTGYPALHYACLSNRLEVVKELLKVRDLDINKPGGDEQNTPLQIACMHGFSDLAAVLIEAGAELYAATPYEALPYALMGGCSKDLIDAVMTKMNLSLEQKKVWKFHALCVSPQFTAAAYITSALIQNALIQEPQLVSSVVYLGFTALHWAALRGNPVIIEQLIKNGANPSAQDDLGQTPLNMFLQRMRKRQSITERDQKIILELCTDAAANIPDRHGMSALHLACQYGNTKLVEYLLMIEAVNPNSVDSQGRSVLYYAVLADDVSKTKGHSGRVSLRKMVANCGRFDPRLPANEQVLLFDDWDSPQLFLAQPRWSRINPNLPTVFEKPMLQVAAEVNKYEYVCALLEREDVALNYQPSAGTTIDLLNVYKSKEQEVDNWIEEIVFKLTQPTVERLALSVDSLNSSDLRSLYLQNPLLIAIALRSVAVRQKVIDHLEYLFWPSNQDYVMQERHDPFVWVTPMLERTDQIDTIFKNAPVNVSLAILSHLSEPFKQQMGNRLEGSFEAICTQYTEALAEKLPKFKKAIDDHTITRVQWNVEASKVRASQSHLINLEPLFKEMGLEPIWKKTSQALTKYAKALSELNPKFSEESQKVLSVEEEAKQEDFGALLSKLVGEEIPGNQYQALLGFHPNWLYESGIDTGLDCASIGANLLPYFKLRNIRQTSDFSSNWVVTIRADLMAGADWLIELSNHLKDQKLFKEAETQKNRLEKALNSSGNDQDLIHDLIKGESTRLKTIFKRYSDQSEKVKLESDKSLSDQYPDQDWKFFWRATGEPLIG